MYLLPEPKELILSSNTFTVTYDCKIILDSNCSIDILQLGKILKEDICEILGFSIGITKGNVIKHGIRLINKKELLKEEYELKIEPNGIEIYGGDYAALLYGIQTLRQIIHEYKAVLPCLYIKDYPMVKNRGFYHDVTRGRIPTLDFLKRLADKLSFYKINQLQLYVEHSYLFEGLSEIWRDDTPLTAEEIMELDKYCKQLNIELIPSLSTFGHLYKLLNTKSYHHLCELEDYDRTEFSFVNRMEHHTIDSSNEESLKFMKRLIEEYMELFTSKHFNLCADETFDLGKGRSESLANELGVDRLYLNYIKELCEFVIAKGKIPMFWGDIICEFPEAIKELPQEVICLNWGYSQNQSDRETKAFYNAKANQYLCPGVNGWNHFIPDINVAYENISRMCTYAHTYEADGVLNTDWGDYGHMNHPELSMIGMIYGACFSWNDKLIDYETLNRRISKLEYGDQKEELVSVIHKIVDNAIYDWDKAIWFKEVIMNKSYEEQKSFFVDDRLAQIHTVNESLKKQIGRLYELLSNIDSNHRKNVKPFIIAANGILIFNEIGAVIGKSYGVISGEISSTLELAGKLETWFYQYKELWRETSKESELYRMHDAINWYADSLRDIKG
jgi:hexosaminidase